MQLFSNIKLGHFAYLDFAYFFVLRLKKDILKTFLALYVDREVHSFHGMFKSLTCSGRSRLLRRRNSGNENRVQIDVRHDLSLHPDELRNVGL